MKRVVLNYLVLVAISVSPAFMSCKNEKVQLLETVTYSSGNYVKYEYNNEDRITKISHYDKEKNLTFSQTFTYSGNDLVKVDFVDSTIEFSKSENKIIVNHDNVETTTIDLNEDGLPTKYEAISDGVSAVGVFEIQGGNLTKHSYKHTRDGEILEGSSNYQYDNKKSPLYNCKTPQWWWIISEGRSVHNNVTAMFHSNGEKTEYRYEFNHAGYPIKCTAKNNENKYESKFKYK